MSLASRSLACAVIILLATGLVPVIDATEEEPTYQEVREFFKPGVSLVLQSGNQQARVPLELSSELVPEDAEGNPDPANTTYVYRGIGQGGSAIVAVRPDLVTISVNRPGGQASRLIFTPEEMRYVAPPDELKGPLTAEVPPGQPDALHVSPPGGGSIQFQRHIRASETVDDRIDPVNVVFYSRGWVGRVDTALTLGGWSQPSPCSGSNKVLRVHDAMHGGSDAWHWQLRHYTKEDACVPPPFQDPRYHLRLFADTDGPWEDTHTPGFRYHTIGPTHWEGVSHCCVDPRRGQDELYADLSPLDMIGNVRSMFIPNDPSDCSSCGNWDGLVDFYQIYPLSGAEPDSCNFVPSYELLWSGSGMVVKWSC